MVLTAGLSGAAVITTFTSGSGQTAWQTAVGTWSTFAFTGNSGLCTVCASPSTPAGTTITATVSGNNSYSGNFGDLFRDVLVSGAVPIASDPSLVALSTTTYTWSGGPMRAVGGIWDTQPLLNGGGIVIDVNLVGGGSQNIFTPAALFLTGGPIFVGWISDTPFTSFTLSTTNNTSDPIGRPQGAEHYSLDNLQVVGVPEPATLSMVGLALLGLGALRRYRRS